MAIVQYGDSITQIIDLAIVAAIEDLQVSNLSALAASATRGYLE